MLAAPKPGPCTRWAEGPSVVDMNDGEVPDAEVGGQVCQPGDECPGAYRVDMALDANPSPTNQNDAALLRVWVCWQDERGLVREIESRRFVVGRL